MVNSESPSSPTQKPSYQVSGFISSSSITNLQFLQKALFRIGMERIVPNRHSRRNSTGNLCFEHTGYKEVLSRYLQPAPIASCHENCKHSFLDHPLEFKPTNPPLEKPSSKPPSTSKKLIAPIPKPSTKDVKINKTSLLKHQIKPAPIESKTQDLKSKIKSKPDPDDPFYMPPSRLPRRYSDVIIPTTGLGDVLDSPTLGGGLTRNSKTSQNKTEPKKNPKLPNSVKAKTPENNGKISKNQFSSTVDQSSRKSKIVKPGGEVVQEKINKADKTQSQSRNDGITASEVKKTENSASDSSRDDERVSGNGQNGSHIFPPSRKHGRTKSLTPLEIKKTDNPTQVRKLATENGNCSPRTPKFNRGKIIDQEAGSSSPRKHKFRQGKVVDENQNSEDNRTSLRRLSSDSVLHTSEKHSVKIALKPCEVETKYKIHVGLNNVIEETASKLIKTRKSKVKALVGAFEMISSNDPKI